ncbi:MAG: YqaA family protein [Cellvibrionaceae bacterium]
MSYFFLFISAFGAATILPLSSEFVVTAMLVEGFSPLWVWLVATTGNTLGATLSWLMGRYLIHFQEKSWFPFKPNTIDRSQRWFQCYGKWSLLMAWTPIIGDALPFIAGVMRVNILWLVILVGIGKGLRYYLLIIAYLQLW